ncbi:hypothetical protein [Desulfolutivibrio sp.]|uniref:hypothetical protein n=1 Tax=Desulfolutivibrio sp. TaxID=2773296 RepID=UPI002F96B719
MATNRRQAGKTTAHAAGPGGGPWTRQACRYLRAAPFPHVSTVLALCAAGFFGGVGFEAFERGFAAAGWALTGMASGWLAAAGLCQADACSRYREYRRVKAIFLRRGFCRRTLRVMSGSRCRRDAALLAAGEIGRRACASRYFRELGYRWRHLAPDAVASDPWRLFDRRFLHTTFVPGKGIGPHTRAGRVPFVASGLDAAVPKRQTVAEASSSPHSGCPRGVRRRGFSSVAASGPGEDRR